MERVSRGPLIIPFTRKSWAPAWREATASSSSMTEERTTRGISGKSAWMCSTAESPFASGRFRSRRMTSIPPWARRVLTSPTRLTKESSMRSSSAAMSISRTRRMSPGLSSTKRILRERSINGQASELSGRGSWTMVSQKVSMDWTTLMNWSRSTGLVT